MNEDVFEKIKSNVNSYIEIRKIAQKEKVSYSIAKIMYNNGKNNISVNQAKVIKMFATGYKISQDIIKTMMIDYGINIKPDWSRKKIIEEYLTASKQLKSKVIHGIKIMSTTDEGLENLEKFINKAFEIGNKEYTSLLEKKGKQYSLTVSDFYRESFYHFNNGEHLININKDDMQRPEAITIFFHETAHFLDRINGNEKDDYSEINPKVREIFDKIGETINSSSVQSIIKNKNIPLSVRKIIEVAYTEKNLGIYKYGLEKKFAYSDDYRTYIHNLAYKYSQDEKLNKKWKEEIEKKHPTYSEEDKELLFKMKKHYERKKYESLIFCIHDILDGITNGKLRDYFGIHGHGKKYYSRDFNKLQEFIAEVGAIYSADGRDVLEYEFGTELANEMMQLFEELMDREQSTTNTKNIEPSDGRYNNFSKEEKISFLKHLKDSIIKRPTSKRR